MRAVKLVSAGRIEIQDVRIPEIADTEVLVKVAGAGLCHSDLHILHQDKSWPFFGTTMGHETSGHIHAVGAAVTDLALGDPVLVRAVWSCGTCRPCRAGRENACAVAGSRTMFPLTPGIGADGGMAEFIKVAAQHVDRIDGLEPVSAAPLADAALTPMHAINSTRNLLDKEATAVVIGVGGLGHMALQILSATAKTKVIAVDSDPAKLDLARRKGAAVVIDGSADVAALVLHLTDGYGADVVYDFVGAQSTVDLATAVVAPSGAVRIVGLGGGSFPFNASLEGEVLPWGVNVERPYGGTASDQANVLALARSGDIGVETVTYPLDDAQRAFDDLEAGRISGRAVLVP
jgi:propanol-preferring alcohol dehydrogenase